MTKKRPSVWDDLKKLGKEIADRLDEALNPAPKPQRVPVPIPVPVRPQRRYPNPYQQN